MKWLKTIFYRIIPKGIFRKSDKTKEQLAIEREAMRPANQVPNVNQNSFLAVRFSFWAEIVKVNSSI